MEITLKAARINKQLQQKDAARALGVSVDTLSNWERGITYPNALQIERIIEVYKIPYECIKFLLNDTDLIGNNLCEEG